MRICGRRLATHSSGILFDIRTDPIHHVADAGKEFVEILAVYLDERHIVVLLSLSLKARCKALENSFGKMPVRMNSLSKKAITAECLEYSRRLVRRAATAA